MSTTDGQRSARKWVNWTLAIVAGIVVLGALWYVWALSGALHFGDTLELGSITTPDGSGMIRIISVEPGTLGRDALHVRLYRPGKADSIVAKFEGKYKLYEIGYSDSLTLRLANGRAGRQGRDTVYIPQP